MSLAADASAIVEEALRARGRDLFEHRDLDLRIAAPTWSEVEHEVAKRLRSMVRHGHLPAARYESTLHQSLTMLRANLTVVANAGYERYEIEARDRIPRDPNDWPTVALALALDCGIWTADQDFFGCGVAVWMTETLLVHVQAGLASRTP